MSNSQDKKNIFVNVLLSDILSKEEITSLRQYPQFQSDDSSDLEKIDGFLSKRQHWLSVSAGQKRKFK